MKDGLLEFLKNCARLKVDKWDFLEEFGVFLRDFRL